jgi:ATP phosphoribosyltransferase
MAKNLIIGIPNKGRLQKDTEEIFLNSGLKIQRGNGEREYTGKMVGIENIDIIFLSPKEISYELQKGSIDIGITGLDLIEEYIYEPKDCIFNLMELGFGFADVVVAVPSSWIDVKSITDLEDVIYDFRIKNKKRLRIATKYPNISRNFFEALGYSDYLLVDSHGATEGAPAYGSSEIIIDITSTGSTLKANQLKRIDKGTILRSQACLFGALNTRWNKEKLSLLENLLSKLKCSEKNIQKFKIILSK